MTFCIGFPVDGGTVEQSFFVKVRLALSQMHYCKGGKPSRLRPNSGAEFVFHRAPLYIQKRYRFEFTPVPMPNPMTRPDNIASSGFSDALACAMALYQRSCSENSQKLLLFSGSFVWQDSLQNIQKTPLERVTNENDAAVVSLFNKWKVAQQANASALFLHEQDAQLLCKHHRLEYYSVSKITKEQLIDATDPLIIGCHSQSFRELQKILSGKRIYKKHNFLYAACILFILIAIYFLYSYKTFHAAQSQYNALFQKYTQRIQYYDISKRDSLWRTEVSQEIASCDTSNIREFLQQKLASPDWQERLLAVYVCGELKEQGKTLVPVILQKVDSRYTWKEAISALRKIAPSVGEMLCYTTHESVVVRRVASETIPYLSGEVSEDMLKHYLQNQFSRSIALKIIAKTGESVKGLLPLLFPMLEVNHPDKEAAAEAICGIGPSAIPLVYQSLEKYQYDKKLLVKILEIFSLSHDISIEKLVLSANHEEVGILLQRKKTLLGSVLENIYRSQDTKELQWWHSVLSKLEINAKEAYLLPQILRCLEQDSVQNSAVAKDLLRMVNIIGEKSESLEKLMVRLLDSPELSSDAAQIIADWDWKSPIIVQKVLHNIQNRVAHSIWLVELCGNLQLSESVALLENLAKAEDVSWKIFAMVALNKIQQKDAQWKELLQTKNIPDWLVCYVNREISKLRPSPTFAIPELTVLFSSEKEDLQFSAKLALLATTNDPSYIHEIINRRNPTQYAIDIVARYPISLEDFFHLVGTSSPCPHLYIDKFIDIHNPSEEEVVTVLVRLSHHRSEETRLYAIRKLFQLQQQPEIFVNYLEKALLDYGESLTEAIFILSSMNHDSRRKVLTKISSGPYNWQQRAVAREVLKRAKQNK